MRGRGRAPVTERTWSESAWDTQATAELSSAAPGKPEADPWSNPFEHFKSLRPADGQENVGVTYLCHIYKQYFAGVGGGGAFCGMFAVTTGSDFPAQCPQTRAD